MFWKDWNWWEKARTIVGLTVGALVLIGIVTGAIEDAIHYFYPPAPWADEPVRVSVVGTIPSY